MQSKHDELGKWYGNNSTTQLVTRDGQVWVARGYLTEEAISLLNELGTQASIFVHCSNGEAPRGLSLMVKAAEPDYKEDNSLHPHTIRIWI